MKKYLAVVACLIMTNSALAITQQDADIGMQLADKAYECAELDYYANQFQDTEEQSRLMLLAYDSIESIAPFLFSKFAQEILSDETDEETIQMMNKINNVEYMKGFLNGMIRANAKNRVKQHFLGGNSRQYSSIEEEAGVLYHKNSCHLLGR